MNSNEHQTAKYLVALALKSGYTCSVFDGEELTLERSVEQATIMQALGTTDSDQLIIRSAVAPFQTLGRLLLVWGNGSADLLADWSDNDETERLAVATAAFGEALEV